MLNIFNTEYKIKTEKEKQIFSIVERMCKQETTDVRINPSNLTVFLSNKVNHYDIVLQGNFIIIVNSVFSLRESFPADFIELVKKVALERASADREKVLQEILRREKEMLSKIEESLTIKTEKK